MEANLKALVILGLFVGLGGCQSTQPTFQQCYTGCFILCILAPPHSVFNCSLQCLRDCLIPKSPMGQGNEHIDNQSFCELGCASTLCSNISTKQKPNEKKVESCVGSCSVDCRKSYLSP